MSFFEHIPVPARLVHKDHLDDVLVSNIRSDVPTWIDPTVLSRVEMTQDERDLITAHYEAGTLQTGQAAYVRRSVPQTLPADVATREGLEWVLAYYAVSAEKLCLAAKYIPEHLEEKLAAVFAEEAVCMTQASRSRLSVITDRLPCNERPARLTFSMINDLENYYFYRKHHEHVPGTMMIEVARQAMYTQIYRSARVKRGDVTITIKSMTCEFDDYVDANYPVTVTVDYDELPDDTPDGPFEARVAEFYQRGRRVAAIRIVGLSISMKLFKRMRNTKPEADDWFIPVKGFAPSVLFQDKAGKRIEGKLCKVSETGMDIVFPQQPEATAPLDFVVCVDGLGYIDGKVQTRNLDVAEDGVRGRMDMVDMSRDSKRKWCEAIKNYSHLENRAGL